jgi:hypothetical protein
LPTTKSVGANENCLAKPLKVEQLIPTLELHQSGARSRSVGRRLHLSNYITHRSAGLGGGRHDVDDTHDIPVLGAVIGAKPFETSPPAAK